MYLYYWINFVLDLIGHAMGIAGFVLLGVIIFVALFDTDKREKKQ